MTEQDNTDPQAQKPTKGFHRNNVFQYQTLGTVARCE